MTQAPLSWHRPLGSTGLEITAVTVGGSPLGSMPAAFGYEVAADDAIELVEAVLDSPIRSLDTSNGYSDGESEPRGARSGRRVLDRLGVTAPATFAVVGTGWRAGFFHRAARSLPGLLGVAGS